MGLHVPQSYVWKTLFPWYCLSPLACPSVSPSAVFHGPQEERFDGDIPFKTKYSNISRPNNLHAPCPFVALWLVSIHFKKMLFWGWLSETLISGDSRVSLEVLATWPLEPCWGWAPSHSVGLKSNQIVVGYFHIFLCLYCSSVMRSPLCVKGFVAGLVLLFWWHAE